MTRPRAACLLLAVVLSGITGRCIALDGSQQNTSRVAGLAKAVDDAIARYQPPGLAVGVVVDGDIVYERSHGELVAGSGAPIDRDTLFKIASNSKAMTAALLARLVDQGRLAWDDPVVRNLPHFRMYDDWVTREIQVRDLLIHNSGLGAGAGDLMLWPEPNGFTREDVIRGLRYLQPVYSFRSRYAYDNTLYIVAGEVAAAAGGAPYDELVRRELFAPLGMTRCQVGAWQRSGVGNVAQPHARREDGANEARIEADAVADVPMMAAGGIRCSLADMLRWASMWLQPERVGLDGDGRPWLSATQREEMWKAHMPMPLGRRMREWDGSHFSAYGYGWRLTDVDGTWKVSHTGTLSGMYSALTLLPEKRAGIVILVNGDAEELRTVLGQVLVKQFTHGDAAGLDVAHYAGLLAAERAAARPATAAAGMPAAPRTRVGAGEVATLTGRYRDPWFGEVAICPQGEGIEFASARSPRLRGWLMHADGRLLVDWQDPGVDAEAWLAFSPVPGREPRLAMSKVDPDADFSYDYEDLDFERIAACR